MNDVMVVTPHSSFRDNLIYDGIAPTAHGNISLSDAANVYCMKPDMICPVCGEPKCIYFRKLCEELLKSPNEQDVKKAMVKSMSVGVPFVRVYDEYRNKVENQLANTLHKNGIIPTKKIRNEMFSKYMNLFDLLHRRVANGRVQYIDRDIKSTIFSKINPKTATVLTYLNTLGGTKNIKNYPKMIETIKKGNFNDASKEFYKKMPQDLESYSALDTLINEAIARSQADNDLKKIQSKVKNEIEKLQTNEAIKSASEIMTDVGEKASKFFGDKYKSTSNKIINELNTFKGKKIKNTNDALRILGKSLSNPYLNIHKKDLPAITQAIKAVDGKKLSENLYKLGTTFKIADKFLKFDKIKNKVEEGFETGDWKPLLLEVEAMALAGVATPIVLAFTAGSLSLLLPFTLSATAISVATIVLTSVVTSFIDANFADAVNKELIPLAN
ncbi:colicin-like pore-forming protein [Providencia rettgeri]|nr:colicin-like pore-forming protein [Providencia rettgeri]